MRTRQNIPIFNKNMKVGKKQENIFRIKDVAERAGVSVGTVDRVIHQRGEVSSETRKKVMEVIEELDFSPNQIASSLATSKSHTTAVLIPEANRDNLFWADHLRGIKRAGIEFSAYGLFIDIYTFSMAGTDDFRKKSEDLLKSGPDSILIAPVFYNESAHFLAKCKKRKIPFCSIDTLIEKFDPVSYIGQNSCQSGAVAARLISIGNEPGSNYLILHLTKEKEQLEHLKEREKGFRAFFENRGELPQIHTEDIHDLSQKSLKAFLRKILKNTGDLKGIFVSGSKVHMIAQSLESLGLRNVRLIGYDLIEPNRKYLKKDLIHFLISQQPEEQGYLGIKSLFERNLQKKDVPIVQSMPIDIITRENLELDQGCL